MPAARTDVIDDVMIHKAKLHSARGGKSLSAVVQDVSANLPENEQETEDSLTPEVRALYGVLLSKNTTEADLMKAANSKYIRDDDTNGRPFGHRL